MDFKDEKIRGYVDYVFFPKTGMDKTKFIQFAGFNIKTNKNEKLKCFGKVPILKEADYFEFTGHYQKQNEFKVDYAIRVDDDILGATSMLIFIFGPKTAQNIIKAYKDDAIEALHVFKNEEQKFYNNALKIPRLGPKSISKAYEKYEKHIAVDVLFNHFSQYGLSLNKALKVYAKWGDKSMKMIEANPYVLNRIDGITFTVADDIAQKFYCLSPLDRRRIESAALIIMHKIGYMGHVYIQLQKFRSSEEINLVTEMKKMLNINEVLIKEAIIELINDSQLIKERQGFTDIIYLPEIYRAERKVAEMVKNFVGPTRIKEEFISNTIDQFERFRGFDFADKQKEAVFTAVKNKFSIISGPPGSGKTTIIDAICETFLNENPDTEIRLVAPTGRAAKKISESTGKKATTIHRMLRYNPMEEQFEFNENNPLKLDVLIIDEFSMCSLTLTYALFKAVPPKAIVLIVGDKDQLPSVQEGKVLEDLLNVPFIPKTILNKIYRQKEGSSLLKKALDISEGKVPSLEQSLDFSFYETGDLNGTQKDIINLYFDKINDYSIEDIMLLTPQNKGELGVDALNVIIQELYNPAHPLKKESKVGKRIFREHDRVIHLVNEEDKNVFNGMIGTITSIHYADDDLGLKEEIYVDYGEEELAVYTRDRFENIKLAYATTVHKAQGSEAPCVIMVVHEEHAFMLRRKILYTGMTRAREELCLLGQKFMIERAINNTEPPRNTKLKYWLKK